MCGVQRLICKHNQVSEPIQVGNFSAETSINISRKACFSGVHTISEDNPFDRTAENKNSGKNVSTSECLTAYHFRSNVTVLLAVSKDKVVPVQAIKT